jgi:hypothetical protein
MYDWMVEADIYRLRKAAAEATGRREGREAGLLTEHKPGGLCSQRAARLRRTMHDG